jgi:ubiquinone/menaquinone biosynthesis C-methylase UbiE
MNDPSDLLSAYFQLMNANGAAHVYREAVRSGLFAALDSDARTIQEICRQCGTAARPTELMLEALAVMGLVSHSDALWRLAPLGSLLLAGSYRNLGDEYWAHLPELLRTDKPLVRMDDAAQSEAHYQTQAAVLGWMLTPAARCAAERLAQVVPPSAAILDLGAGSGIWSLTLASLLPQATVTAVDWPAVLAVAAEMAQELGVADRLQTIAGNFHEVELPHRHYDLAIVANVTHLLTPEGNRALLNAVHKALQPGGLVGLIDVFPGQPAGDLNRTLYALGLALRTERSRVYSAADLQPLLQEAGFDELQLVSLPVPPYAIGMLLAAARGQILDKRAQSSR